MKVRCASPSCTQAHRVTSDLFGGLDAVARMLRHAGWLAYHRADRLEAWCPRCAKELVAR